MATINALKLLQSTSWSSCNNEGKAVLMAAIAMANSKGFIKCSRFFIPQLANVDEGPDHEVLDKLIADHILDEVEGGLEINEWVDFGIASSATRQARHRAKLQAQAQGGTQ